MNRTKLLILIAVIIGSATFIRNYIDTEMHRFDMRLADTELRLYNAIQLNTELINKN